MASYKTMYLRMFNVVTDVEQQLQQLTEMLKSVQQDCEEMYLNSDDTPISLPTKHTNQDE